MLPMQLDTPIVVPPPNQRAAPIAACGALVRFEPALGVDDLHCPSPGSKKLGLSGIAGVCGIQAATLAGGRLSGARLA
jgi:hypothetical protein